MNKLTLGAVVVFAALLTLYLGTNKKQVNEGVPTLELPKVDPGQVTGLDLSGAEQAVLSYKDGKWSVADPKAPTQTFAADEAQVKSALEQLGKLKATDFVTKKADKQASLQVDDAKGLHVKVHGVTPELDLVLGKPANGGFYLREEGKNEVFVGTGGLASALRKDVTGWRKKAITTFAAADVTKLQVTPAQGDAFTVEKGPAKDAEWKLTSPAPKDFRFDPPSAVQLTNRLGSLQAQSFQAAAPAASEPVTTFVATLKDGKTVTMKLGKKDSAGMTPFSVDGDPQVYLLAGYSADQLDKGLDGLRDTKLVAVDASKVTAMTITTSKGKTVVQKDGTAWKVVEPKTLPTGVTVDVTTIPTMVQRLSLLRGAKVVSGVSDAKAGLGKPTATLAFAIDGKTQTIRFGADAESGQAYAKGSADALLYELPVFERNELDQGVALFKKRPPPSFQGLDQLPPELRAKLMQQLQQRQVGTN